MAFYMKSEHEISLIGYHSSAAKAYVDLQGLKSKKSGYYLKDVSLKDNELKVQSIGMKLHEEPQVPNYKTPRRGPKLRKGIVLAIEPRNSMATCHFEGLDDDWTVVTRDDSLSAHYEDTVVITDDIPKVLTLVSSPY